jgi:hypothetical protein
LARAEEGRDRVVIRGDGHACGEDDRHCDRGDEQLDPARDLNENADRHDQVSVT